LERTWEEEVGRQPSSIRTTQPETAGIVWQNRSVEWQRK
jgi:hypothetical protein